MHADVADEFLFVEEFALDKGNLFVCLYRSKDELFPRFEKKKGGRRFLERSPARKDTNVIRTRVFLISEFYLAKKWIEKSYIFLSKIPIFNQ